MPRETTLSLIRRYYDAFNAGDPQGMLACLTDDICHRVNEDGHRIGRAKFAEFYGQQWRNLWESDRFVVCRASRTTLSG